ncbi:MAG: PEP-CTERM sorting domain-containing protein [Planctomycetota bacterium]
MKRLIFTLLVVSVISLVFGTAQAGVEFLDPAGGWTYIYTGDAATGSLDGTWDHDNGSDQWDESVIGAGRPGGVSALGGYVRLQETGDPRNHGMGDPGSNRKLYFGHSITSDIGTAGDAILDDGVTISFRARVATGAPLDDMHPDTAGDGEFEDDPIAPWPAGGNGYLGHDGGKGNFSIRQLTDDKIISFSLPLASESMKYDPTVSFEDVGGAEGLVMNNLVTDGDEDPWEYDGAGESLNLLPAVDMTKWHEFWITIEADLTATGTHLVKVYTDGWLTPYEFIVSAGGGNDFDDSYIGMGVGATGQMGAIDVDFFAYAPGVIVPVPEPATVALLGLGGLFLIRRKRR